MLEIESKLLDRPREEVVAPVPEPLDAGDVVQYKLAGMLNEVNGPELEVSGPLSGRCPSAGLLQDWLRVSP